MNHPGSKYLRCRSSEVVTSADLLRVTRRGVLCFCASVLEASLLSVEDRHGALDTMGDSLELEKRVGRIAAAALAKGRICRR
ncbi:MAG: hypothetical protein P1U77_26190 [Rubripirellula sp.]|nr:hypothetical protein [Rubripirellula sp.]